MRRWINIPCSHPLTGASNQSRPRTTAIGAALVVILSVSAGAAWAESPAAAARAFIGTLSTDEAEAARAAFGSPDRQKIRFTPGTRGGLSLKAMDSGSAAAAIRLLETSLSAEGVRMVAHIRQREKILGEMTNNPGYRDPKLYYLALFGEPGKGLWSYRFEGHHLSINMTYRDDTLISAVPVILASNPEKTDSPGAPPELLTPLVRDARASAGDAAARQRVIDALTAHIPAPLRTDYRQALADRKVLGLQKKTWSGLDLQGGHASVEVETNQTNHIHITFRDRLRDFGGAK